ncbi:MAG TPA: peptidoglycan-binding domain-containing protein [Humibacillus xanthopallidus]|nr:peptidoglycan-binding domain-containing protein [Humibacillus xanthopallidus]
MTRRSRTRVAVAALAVSLLAGCGSADNGNTAVQAAEARVTSKQKALDDAKASAAAATAQFCSSSAAYITALDRYGDILNQTAPTVGDVTTAGRDLKQPSADAVSAGQAAASAHEAIGAAEQELATAEAELAKARAAATGGTATATPTASASPTPSSTPTVPGEVVTRVQQAESDFATAQAGISDATPLRAASVQFNAAAVALQMAWLQLYAATGCLTDAQQEKAAAAVHDYTTALQQDLADAGYFTGKVDGVYGPTTVAAVEALQKAHGLPVTGSVDKATEAALRADLVAKGGATAGAQVASTAAVQQTLKLAGYWDGPVDGQWTDALTEAVTTLQKDLGVPTTGKVDAATVSALEKAIATAKETPTATVTSTVTSTVTTTVSPSSPATP